MKSYKGREITKKLTALFIVFTMLFSLLPWKDIEAYAEGFEHVVDTITIFKIYDYNRNLEQRRVLITGSNLKDASVGIVTSSGYQELKNRTVNTSGLLQFDIGQDQVGNSILVNGTTIEINEGQMPTLTGVNRKVKHGIDNLVLQGTNLTKVNDGIDINDKIHAFYEHEGAYTELDPSVFINDTLVTIGKPTGALGLQNVIFQKVENLTKKFNNQDYTVKVTVKYTYKDQFRLVSEITSDGLEMRPNRGEKGNTIFFEAPTNNLLDYDVFFLKNIDGTDPYTNSNKGINKTFQPNINDKAVLTVQIPDLPVGEYYVVLTNAISLGKDPMKEVVQEKIIGAAPNYEKFTIIDGNIKSKIINIQPQKGFDTGSSVIISGQFIGTLNIPEFKPDNDILTVEDIGEPQELTVNYGTGKYNGKSGYTASRKIKVIIGGNASFINKIDTEYQRFNTDLDKITVQTALVTDADVNPIKDVVVETETIITNGSENIIVKERAEVKNGFTYIPSKVIPVIDKIITDKIQVNNSNEIFPGRMLAIYGKDFLIHKYTKLDGTKVTRYPVIELGPIVIDKNQNPDIEIKIFDEQGKELDGTEGNELGTKILIKTPSSNSFIALGKNYLKVTNPMRNSENLGLSAQKIDFIEFVKPSSDKNPSITSINPNTVTIDGGENVVIDGNNFRAGVKVFLDGQEISTINRQEDGKKITFKVPKGREGETQLQVMNPEGGMDIGAFTYVKTYTNPKIIEISPKAGDTGTYVMIRGENFLKSDPTSSEEFIHKLIGTRVFLENKDINEYYLDPISKKIALQEFISNDDDLILSIVGDKVKAADYYNSVILEVKGSSPKQFYTLDVDYKGNVLLSNGAGDNYIIQVANSKLIANREGGNSLSVTVTNDNITIGENPNELVLKLKTLFTIENGKIVGNRVKVIDRNQLFFTVPMLEANGYYDVTIINPDTKKDTLYNEKGFYFYKQPISNPLITKITPSEGSVDGGYTIQIEGQDFEDNGSTKTKVFIDGLEIKVADIQVSTNGRMITVKVPSYRGDLWQDKGTDRLTVPVIVVNPDGASVSEVNGFTYVIPTSQPRITSIISQKGTAAGGDVVDITGSDFRYVTPKKVSIDGTIEYLDINGNNQYDDGEELEKKVLNHKQYQYYYDSPLLPKVYFGSNIARIVEISKGYLKVISPSGKAGEVEVYLINNDSGISNKVLFKYEASNPKITDIILSQGKKQGREKVDIHGSGFAKSNIQMYDFEQGNMVVKEIDMPLVRFGSIDNKDVPREEENSGTIQNGRATVQLGGGLRIEYFGDESKLKVFLEEGGSYKGEIIDYDDSVKYIPLSLLEKTDAAGTYYGGYELIRIEVVDRRVFVERGYSPQVDYINQNLLTVNTPSYYTVGKVPVRVINPDGGTAQGEFEYKNPSSRPKINNITKEGQEPSEEVINGEKVRVIRVSYKGGNIVSIIGEDFRENVSVQISNVANIPYSKITRNLSTKLTFEIPKVTEAELGKLHKLVVLNDDGGSAASDLLAPELPIYLMFIKGETNPVIERISPDKGVFTGGTRVKIEGKDFRETIVGIDKPISVYFGENRVPDNNVTVVDYKTIYVNTPPGTPGTVNIRVENPDGELTKEEIIFTYLSAPSISTVIDIADNTPIENISVIGGQEIKIKGSGFLEGAKVIFMPILTKIENEVVVKDKVAYINGEPYMIKAGNECTAKYIDENTLIVVTPEGKIDARGIVVINPDRGTSYIYDNLVYGLPKLKVPTGIKADLVFDRYIKINWTGVEEAKEYEVFAIIDYDYDKPILVGKTEFTSYSFEDLMPNTKYRFYVKAIGDFGSSEPSAYSSTVQTYNLGGFTDSDGGLNELTKAERIGDVGNITIGKNDYYYKGGIVDLTKGTFAGCKELVISIPATVVVQNNLWDLTVIGKDNRITFNPNSFNVAKIKENRYRKDAGVRLKISVNEGSGVLEGLKDNKTSLSLQYTIEAEVFVGKEKVKIDTLSSPIFMTFYFDSDKAKMRKLSNISLSRYDDFLTKWVDVAKPSPNIDIIFGRTEKLGTYQVIGGRR